MLKMIKGSVAFAFVCVQFMLPGLSQAPMPAWHVGEVQQELNHMQVLGSVLYIAAHPDDENTSLLAYFAQEKGYRTGYLSLTRGDGGQNLIGDEKGSQLGLLRTQELLAARRIDGAEQMFSRAIDFGYSKVPEETLTKWDREVILSDVVWAIRKFRPDVIVTRFAEPDRGGGGHGHHTTSAILAREAFHLAADETAYPEQLEYVDTWQPKRIFWNLYTWRRWQPSEDDIPESLHSILTNTIPYWARDMVKFLRNPVACTNVRLLDRLKGVGRKWNSCCCWKGISLKIRLSMVLM